MINEWQTATQSNAPSLTRRRFLSMIDLGEVTSCASIFYDPVQNEFGDLMITEPSEEAKRGIIGANSTIRVFPLTFDPRIHQTLDDCLSTVDHELEHVKINKEGNYNLSHQEKESRCYTQQLAKIESGQRKVSYAYKSHLMEMLQKYIAAAPH